MLSDIKSMTMDEICEDFSKMKLPSFRAKQVFSWLHKKGVCSFDEMTDLSKNLRDSLLQKYYISSCEIEKKLVSEYDNTTKYLFKLNDGEYVESVLMQYKHGYSICISTQVGCRMGCAFCATGLGGLSRNLTASEMLSQIQAAQIDAGIRISNVVLMGMGEPLDNFNNLIRFLDLMSDENGIGIGMRHISVSTCGLVDKIYQLIPYKYQFTLSVSLHAPTDEIRNTIMPVNRRWNVDTLLKACRDYTEATSRRISFEYTLIDSVNDREETALILAKKLKGMLCHVNLISVNSVRENKFVKADKGKIKRFMDILDSNGINVTLRRTLGSDIDASCGQLRRKTLGE